MLNIFRKKIKPTQELFFRKTIKYPGLVEGAGLHSGKSMTLRFQPAESNTGIVFFRHNGNDEQYLPVELSHVIDTSWAVTLGNENFHIQTVEHLLYAVSVLGITDMFIEINENSQEVPILDGSAHNFIESLQRCEFHEYEDEIEPIVIREPVFVSDGDRYLVGMPSAKKRFEISCSIDYPHPLLKNISTQLTFDRPFFVNTIGRARTIGFVKEVDALKKMGLAKGGTTENVLVYDDKDTVNTPRFTNEALYHKILDLVGDLALIGRPIIGHILASKSGHSLDVAFGKKLLQQYVN